MGQAGFQVFWLKEGTSISMFAIDLYNGLHGVTLRMATQEPTDFENLQHAARKLAAAYIETILLSTVGSISKGHHCDLVCVAKQGGLQVRSTKDGMLELTQNRDGWLLCAGLIEGLLKSGGGGHHYIGLDCGYGAIVELSFKE